MLSSKIRAALVATVGVLALAVAAAGLLRGGSVDAVTAPTPSPRPEEATGRIPSASQVNARVPQGAAPDGSPAAGSPGEPEPEREDAGFGEIGGGVYDPELVPLPGHSLVFIDATTLDRSRQVRARTDAEGQYWLERVPAGTWDAYHKERPRGVPEDMLEPVGRVEVVADRYTAFDVTVGVADRVLSGRLTLFVEGLPENSGVLMEYELLSKWDPSRIVARGSSASYRKAPWERDEDEAAAPPPEGLEPEEDSPLRVGAFRFQRLEPDFYILRAWVSRTDRLYIDQEIDLTLGDVTLPDRDLTLEEFARAKYAREGKF